MLAIAVIRWVRNYWESELRLKGGGVNETVYPHTNDAQVLRIDPVLDQFATVRCALQEQEQLRSIGSALDGFLQQYKRANSQRRCARESTQKSYEKSKSQHLEAPK